MNQITSWPRPAGAEQLADALWRIYRRPDTPAAWQAGGNLPWNDPAFSERMLREHLDESHSAASRTAAERAAQIAWLWSRLELAASSRVLDLTCGPGLYAVALASRGCRVTGIDFSPASIRYARELAERTGVADHCTFIEHDVRTVTVAAHEYDAVLLLYGQLAVFTRQEAAALLQLAADSLRPGGRLCIELLDQEKVDKSHSTWWFTGDSGLWGDAPFLNFGERFWDATAALSMERFYTLHLASAALDEVLLCDQTYAVPELTAILQSVGFDATQVYAGWNGLPLYDAAEWNVYVGQKRSAE
ncbi:MAG: class I SAM-dependent methyltransferase [Caldilinea sp.]|mgnify:FL=1|uniref:SAM-dependent methyltransferase n=1 Tax=Caldilinea sp. TaxID=2293560 RepID=UPI002B75B751|nr:class I SAM-dependent methyltransferase [Anaerolineales bacterium]HQY94612.1 class I SAM-dependent methyltransferase [Caldilinea sp.]HRA68921.1 class I SAM-dependent methyltransferase [Caldilinea sp.]